MECWIHVEESKCKETAPKSFECSKSFAPNLLCLTECMKAVCMCFISPEDYKNFCLEFLLLFCGLSSKTYGQRFHAYLHLFKWIILLSGGYL